ncbi:Cas10/Cmr2 second palm domain-containing protein [[Clostridium] scindens]|uniref:Cas10/Cmr2 second palm domain-containing protein n=1 Tax=Clostridium scindens (strain JCM 10418 / VPI 12708) TaxID=29347 RepID=UPI0039A022B4
MKDQVVAISIDKIQTALFEVIKSGTQEKQTNSGTLRSIMAASRKISGDFYRDVGIEGDAGEFAGKVKEILLQCSGVCIFTTTCAEDEISKRLKRLFAKFYRESGGKLILKYVLFTEDVSTGNGKLKAIQNSKELLKSKACMNQVVKENQEILFQFLEYHEEDISAQNEEGGAFVQTINDLRASEQKSNENKQDKGSFRIVVIKADLDGMGSAFQKIQDFEVYQKVSSILNQYISMEYLEEKVRGFQINNSEFKVYPLYVAGDDIFFAVGMENLIEGINLCKWIVKELNSAIEDTVGTASFNKLTLSIGLDFAFNREPIRYYFARVDDQLKKAKKAKALNKAERKRLVARICINDVVYYDVKREEKSKKKKAESDVPKWEHVIHGLKVVKRAEKEGIEVTAFLYELLRKLKVREEDPTGIIHSNLVLYHLLPQYLDDPCKGKRKAELLLLENILSFISFGKKNKTKELNFDQTSCTKLVKYISLLLLLCDTRFNIREAEKSQVKYDKEKMKKVFKRPLRYLYKNSLYELWVKSGVERSLAEAMRDIFVNKAFYTNPNPNKDSSVEVYQTLQITNSMFMRFKRFDMDIDAAAVMITALNPKTEEDYLKEEEERKCTQPPGNLYFREKDFKSTAAKSGLWKKEYVDALMIFYRFNRAKIHYLSTK